MVNDRWGGPHKDYATSEYEHFSQPESETQWEKCRGVGFSFGYNQVEGRDSRSMAGSWSNTSRTSSTAAATSC